MRSILRKVNGERGNTLIENVIILPLIFIIIYSLILTCFIVHDRSTLEAAAKRGAIYAAHCISDPNYANILAQSGNTAGAVDISKDVASFSFTGVGKNIQPYRYITHSSTNGIEEQTKTEILSIVNATRIPWRTIEIGDIDVEASPGILYSDVAVTITARYPLPQIFGAFGLETEYTYSVTAKMTVNDPDEFVRNADLVVDLIAQVDEATGGHLSAAKEKISSIATKIVDWLKI